MLQRAISIYSGDSQAHFLLGDALDILGRHEDAVASYDRAIAIPPNIVDLHLNRGAALMPLNRHEEALATWLPSTRQRSSKAAPARLDSRLPALST